MPNTENDLDNSEEYNFTEEHPEEYEYENEPLSSGPIADIASKINFKYKRILIPILLIVVIYLIYQFLSWYSAKDKNQDQPTQGQTVTVTKQPDTSKLKTNVTTATTPKMDYLQQQETTTTLQKELETLTQEVESNREQLANLSDDLAKNQQLLGSLDDAISSITATINNIGKQVQQLTAKKTATKKSLKIAPKKVYHIKAVVPGRAWLEDNEGQTITVKVGDRLHGYGRITMISPKDGTVVLSNGDIIQYGVYDY